MKIPGQLYWTDFLEAERLRNRPSRIEQIGLWVIAALAALALLFALYKVVIGEVPLHILLLGILLVAVFLVPYFVLRPLQYWSMFRSRKDLGAPFELETEDRGLYIENEFGSSLWYWDKFANWKESAGLLVLYQPNGTYCLIPKRAFTDEKELDLIRKKLSENHIPVFQKQTDWSNTGMIWLMIVLAILLVVLNLAGVGRDATTLR